MTSFVKTIARVGSAALFTAAIFAGGCAHEQPQEAPPYIPPPQGPRQETSERGMTEPVEIDLLEPAIDEAAQYLITELPNLDVVKNSKNQLVLALPPSLEHDSHIPDGRLQSSLVSLRNKLSHNETFKDNFVVITKTELEANTTIKQFQNDNSTFRDPLQREPDKTHATKYDPASVYLLSGKFYKATDPDAGDREYKLFFHIEGMRSRERLLEKEIVIRLKWDTQAGQWRVQQ
jgi:hypothetical protein